MANLEHNPFEFSHSGPITCCRCGCGVPREDALCRVEQENDSEFSDKSLERRYYCPPCLLRLQEARHKGEHRAMLVQTIGLGFLVALMAFFVYEVAMGFSGTVADLLFWLTLLLFEGFLAILYWRGKRRR